ncbi:MAG: NTP transferase domain-containing protein [Anaerolineae bacterium]|nr:NTP transferase domain-containing protein [Anaerolineae bacterium]
MIEHVIVMAASSGRKLESLTRTRPKAMLPLLGKPLVAWVMDSYYKAGIRRFTVVVGEREGDVAGWLTSNWYSDVKLSFALQGHQRGTASALFATRAFIDGPFIAASVDVILPDEQIARLAGYFDTHPSDIAVLNLFYAPDQIMEGAAVLLGPRGNVLYISEQPTGAHQDYMTALPVYGFTPRVLDYLDNVPVVGQSGKRVLPTAIQVIIDDQGVVGALEAGWCMRLNEPADLLKANTLLMSKYEESIVQSHLPESAEITPPVHIDPGVKIGNGVKLGPNVYLESGSTIGSNAVLQDVVVLGAEVDAGQRIERQVIGEDSP